MLERLARPPVSEDEAMRLSLSGQWSEPEFRARKVKEWTKFASEKYQAAGAGSILGGNLSAIGTLLFFVGMAVWIKGRARGRIGSEWKE